MSVGLNNVNAISFNARNNQNEQKKSNNFTLLGTVAGTGYGGFKLYKAHKDGTMGKVVEKTSKILDFQGASPELVKSTLNIGFGLHLAKYAGIGLGIGAILDFIVNKTKSSG